MKKMLTVAIVMCITISMFTMLAREVKATAMAQVWRDDFDYQTKEEMRNAGWRLDNEAMLSVGGGTLTIDNDGSVAGSAYYLNHFPSNIYEFRVEDRVMWVGRSYGGPRVLVNTTRHSYIWAADAYYHNYVFSRDGVKILSFGEYLPQLNVWQIFSLEKKGNTFYLYQNNEQKNTYIESDGTQDTLVGVAAISHWIGTLKYDYISLEAPSEEIPLWMQWWFWTMIALGAIVVVLAFTTVHYRRKPSVSKETNVMQSKTAQKANKVCPKCGANLPADSKFCGKCGTSLE
jgi:ribosomal protein L40E